MSLPAGRGRAAGWPPGILGRLHRWTLPCLALTALPPAPALAHHPVGIPQYRESGDTIEMIYNVLTQDHAVSLRVRPGRPACPPPAAVTWSARIEPRDPAITFPGATWASLVEDLGDAGEREVAPPARLSESPGSRTVEGALTFDRPGRYVVRIEFTESPGREVLSFPLPVERSGAGSRRRTALLLGVAGGAVAALALARLAAARRRTAGEPPR